MERAYLSFARQDDACIVARSRNALHTAEQMICVHESNSSRVSGSVRKFD
jgi:hypothetical protein